MKFWDTSALAPLLVTEPGSERREAQLLADPVLVVWYGTPVELESALSRRRREGRLEAAEEAAARARWDYLEARWWEVEHPLGGLRPRGRPSAARSAAPAGEACGRRGSLRRSTAGEGCGRHWGRDKELAGDWRIGVVTTNHPTTLRRGPPLLGKEGSAFAGVRRRESGVRSQEAGVRSRVENTTHLVNHGLPSSREEGGTRA